MHYSTLIAIDIPHLEEDEVENKKVREQIKFMKENKPEGRDYLYDMKLEELQESQTTFARAVAETGYEFLAPFAQDAEEYQEFFDITEELKKTYETGADDFVRTPDGRVIDPYLGIREHKFTVQDGKVYEYVDRYRLGDGVKRTKLAKKMKALVNYPYKKAYKNFDLFATEGRGEVYNEKENGYGYYLNPNACFDWCTIGGRWPNMFLVKEKCQEVYICAQDGAKKDTPKGYKWVTAARMKDIEWKRMKEIDKQRRIKEYHTYVEYFSKGEVPPVSYLSLTENGLYAFGEAVYLKGEKLKDYLLRKGISSKLKYPCMCYGYFDDGVYHERWEYSSAERKGADRAVADWQKEVDVYLDGLNPDAVLVGVDIHI